MQSSPLTENEEEMFSRQADPGGFLEKLWIFELTEICISGIDKAEAV